MIADLVYYRGSRGDTESEIWHHLPPSHAGMMAIVLDEVVRGDRGGEGLLQDPIRVRWTSAWRVGLRRDEQLASLWFFFTRHQQASGVPVVLALAVATYDPPNLMAESDELEAILRWRDWLATQEHVWP